jgi:hypothetical protein
MSLEDVKKIDEISIRRRIPPSTSGGSFDGLIFMLLRSRGSDSGPPRAGLFRNVHGG